MTRKEAERLVDAMLQYNDAGMLNEFGAAYAEIIASLCQEPNQPEGQPDGPGEYLLSMKVYVRRNEDGTLSTWEGKHIPCGYIGDTHHITGHWQKIDK